MFQLILKELRENNGLSQAKLADKIGVAQSTVGMWENGKNKPEYATLLKLAELFNVSVDYMTGANQNEKQEPPSDPLADQLSDLSPESIEKIREYITMIRLLEKCN